jgi:SAM-dependent methyltransferase
VSKLALTGERTAPGWERERYWFLRHLAVYQWIAGTVISSGNTVVDVGSGEGFGANILADHAAHSIALELDEPTCRHAHYTYPHVTSVCANVIALPLATASVDVAVTLQVMEHVWDVPGYLAELRRVCRGTLALSTPNRPVFSPGLGRFEKPVNPFHVEEFDAEQVSEACSAAGFDDVRMFGLHHGDRIKEWESRHGSLVTALIHAAVNDQWPESVMALQASLEISDFQINEHTDGAHDLIAVAT